MKLLQSGWSITVLRLLLRAVMYNGNDGMYTPKTRGNRAFVTGTVVGLLLVGANLVLWAAWGRAASADRVTWLIGWLFIFLAARTAVRQQADLERDNVYGGNAGGAGIGTALVAITIVWVYIVLRDFFSSTALLHSLWLILRLPLDLFLAVTVGGLAGWQKGGDRASSADSFFQ